MFSLEENNFISMSHHGFVKKVNRLRQIIVLNEITVGTDRANRFNIFGSSETLDVMNYCVVIFSNIGQVKM